MGGKSANVVRSDWLTRTPKWMLLGGFWTAQGIVLYFAQALLYASQSTLDTSENQTQELIPDGFFGTWPTLENYLDLLANTEFVLFMLGTIAALTIAQMVFLLPVRRPGLAGEHGRSIKRSLYTAGAAIGLLLLASIMGIAGFLDDVHDINLTTYIDFPGDPYTTFGGIILFGWLIATPILIRFSKPGRKEDVLARLSKKLFIGTIIEIALLIPLDVMVRRKTSCYCWAGTYWALTICGFIGIFALGPAVFLPILSKRRKTWYSGHCGVCAYDMSGTPDALRCPECGTGWKTDPSVPASGAIDDQ